MAALCFRGVLNGTLTGAHSAHAINMGSVVCGLNGVSHSGDTFWGRLKGINCRRREVTLLCQPEPTSGCTDIIALWH